jgi:thiol-disulfide isomerase/thioredoxin
MCRLRLPVLPWLGLVLLLTACAPSAPPSLVGSWRAVLASPGGELPFRLDVRAGSDGSLQAHALNADEKAPFSGVRQDGRKVVFELAWYDARIEAELDGSGERLTGRWVKTIAGGQAVLPFSATKGAGGRFLAAERAGLEGGAEGVLPSIAGSWALTMTDEEGTSTAQAELAQAAELVTGTVLTPTGDHRYLEGRFEDGLLRLSTFDGAHAFLYQARVQPDGSLAGDFWSRDTYHATWTARRLQAGEVALPDAWAQVGLTNPEGHFRFAFDDLAGNPVRSTDARFAGKVLVVNVFGSWCPNCNDEAPLLAKWAERYRERGLEVVGLAYEVSGNPERDREMVRRYATRHGIDYPLLLAGTSDKAEASKSLPDLSAVLAFPTTVFVGRDGRVRKIHSGFAGPGTGEHHTKLVRELESTLETLLAEPG